MHGLAAGHTFEEQVASFLPRQNVFMIAASHSHSATHGDARRMFLSAVLLVAFGACESNMPTDAPEPPIVAPAFLESSELLPGGHGVLVSAGFPGLDLVPAVEEGGNVIPDRWTNLRITLDGTEVDSRRLEATRIQFDVPVLPAGDVTVQVQTPVATSTTTGRVRGLLASRRIDDCAANDYTTPVAIADEVVFSLYCPADTEETAWRLGYASTRPDGSDPRLRWFDDLYIDDTTADGMRRAVIHPGPSTRSGHFVARRPGPSTEPLSTWLWKAGPTPAPVEPLTCFPDTSGDDVTSATVDLDGTCVASQAGFLRRDAVPIAECCVSDAMATFVISPDGSAALRHVADLVVVDPGGHIDFRIPYGQLIDDVAFSRNGERVYVAVAGSSSSIVDVRDRQTSELLERLEFEGRVNALAVSGDRLWLTRELPGDGPFAVELYDAGTLTLRRTIALPRGSLAPPRDALTGTIAVLRQNEEGTRLFLTSLVGGILRSDVIEVF